ncbi:unnamed protein product [Toxocara canis]|uniref:Uncharacterized protein n=1 Tax=Toxocara canis TaxID=6265 RepID=A0A183UQQ4_TOXCA|nr:unnamed protein product [Toxocara canis]
MHSNESDGCDGGRVARFSSLRLCAEQQYAQVYAADRARRRKTPPPPPLQQRMRHSTYFSDRMPLKSAPGWSRMGCWLATPTSTDWTVLKWPISSAHIRPHTRTTSRAVLLSVYRSMRAPARHTFAGRCTHTTAQPNSPPFSTASLYGLQYRGRIRFKLRLFYNSSAPTKIITKPL